MTDLLNVPKPSACFDFVLFYTAKPIPVATDALDFMDISSPWQSIDDSAKASDVAK